MQHHLQQMQIMLKCSECFGLCESQHLYRFIENNPINYVETDPWIMKKEKVVSDKIKNKETNTWYTEKKYVPILLE